MAKSFEVIIILFWAVQAVRQTITWTYWWQVKEYRWDRFSLLFEEKDGRADLGIKNILNKFFFTTLSFTSNLFLLLLLYIYIVDIYKLLCEIKKKSLRKPVLTKRAGKILIVNIVFIFIILALYFMGLNVLTTLIIGEIIVLITPELGVYLTKLIVEKIKNEETEKAENILTKINPEIIGVTGSYGKTTTKDFIYQYISLKNQSVKTEGSENTQFGIIRKIQNSIQKGTKYFVVEMGAYKVGEIKNLCMIVKPDISVITGIEEQHLSLFKSLENIKKAKFEIVEALPKGGIAIFNLSNEYCYELYKKAKRLDKRLKVYGYLSKDNKKTSVKTDFYSVVKSISDGGMIFDIFEKGKKYQIKTNLHGKHFIENVTGAILVARLLGVTWKDIINVSTKLQEPEGTMRVKKVGRKVLVDDTHNSTPKGFAAAVEYLSNYKNYQKIVITPGIIELGNKTKEIHVELTKILDKNVDSVIVTRLEPFNQMKTSSDFSKKLEFINDNDRLIKFIKNFFRNDTVILLEGRMPAKVMKYIENIGK